MADHKDGWEHRAGAARYDYWKNGQVEAIVAPESELHPDLVAPDTRWGIVDPRKWGDPLTYPYATREEAQRAAEHLFGLAPEPDHP